MFPIRTAMKFRLLSISIAVFAGGGVSAAQVEEDECEMADPNFSCPTQSLDPTVGGYWDEPICLHEALTASYNTHEIVHAAVLPPPAEDPSLIRVLLQAVPYYPNSCVSGDPPSNQLHGRTYLWKPYPNQRTTATLINPPPDFPTNGTQDLFCAGHTFLADGKLLWVGGTNYDLTCQNAGDFHGTKGIWLLDPIAGVTPTWVDYSTVPAMHYERWYPSAVTLHDGSVFVFGHVSQPLNPDIVKHREELSSAGAFVGLRKNHLHDGIAEDCLEDQLTEVGNYARLHLLSNGLLMNSIRGRNNPEPALFLDVGDEDKDIEWSCEDHDTDPDTWRWRPGSGEFATPDTRHDAGNSVHIIGWVHDNNYEDGQGADEFTEAVYVIGGTDNGVKDTDCVDATSGNVFNRVIKMVNPDISAPWVEGVADMANRRANHNTVILLDGSLLVVGGVRDGDDSCVPVLEPELYKPVEIFGGNVELVEWATLNPQCHKRGYHSVASLLPDGSVISAGGDDENDIYFNSEHSLEVYHPPYSYWEAMRPEIVWTEDLEEPLGYNQQLQFEVRGTSNAPPERVGLIRNSAVTHGVDMSQRYVELARFEEFEPVEGTGNRKYTARMLTPRDPYYAPPGYYMMSVVLEDGSVSHAVWIRLTQ